MKRLTYPTTLCLSFMTCANSSLAQLPQTAWASVFYGLTSPYSLDCAVSSDGSSYVLGEFSGTADFDPGTPMFMMDSGDGNVFVVKLDATGTFAWAKQFGQAYATAIEVDSDGNAYITGSFYNTAADFDPGPPVVNLAAYGGYVLKLSPSGNFAWVRLLGGPVMIVRDMAIDSLGNSVITGNFQGDIDFDPGIDTLEIASVGGDDAFVSKLSSNGDLVWAVALGGLGNEDGLSAATDADGNTYVGGYFQDTADFDTGPSTFELFAVGGGDAYVWKLNAQGELDWAISMGGTASNYSDATTGLTYSNGQLIAAGTFTTSGDFDPSAGTAILSSSGGVDLFVTRLTTGGLFNGVSQIGGWEGNEFCNRVVSTPSGDILLSGNFQGSVDFDPGAADATLSTGTSGQFVCKWNAVGDYMWAFSGAVEATAARNSEEIYCIGSCAVGADVDPSTSVYQVSQSGALTMKLDQLGTTGLPSTLQRFGLSAQRSAGTEHSWLISFSKLSATGSFRVVDMQGHFIQAGQLGEGTSSLTVDLTSWPNGMYVVEVVQNSGRRAIRITR